MMNSIRFGQEQKILALFSINIIERNRFVVSALFIHDASCNITDSALP